MYGHTIIYKKSMDQPGKVANPPININVNVNVNVNVISGQSKGKNDFIPQSPFAPEILVSRDRFRRPVPRHPPHSGGIRCLLAGFLPLSAAASIYSIYTANR